MNVEKELKVGRLMTSQLLRSAAVYERNPIQALQLLHDYESCPIDRRDAAWHFYNRACKRWEKARLDGHTGTISNLAFSPDGKTLVSVGRDAIRFWDVETGKQKADLELANAICATYSPDGKTLVLAGGMDTAGQIVLWDVAKGQRRTALRGHTGRVNCVAFRSDGKVLATGSSDRTVRLWSMETGAELTVLEGHSSGVRDVAFRPDGKTLASCGGIWDGAKKTEVGGEIRLWDVTAKRELVVLSESPSVVYSVAFSPMEKPWPRPAMVTCARGTLRQWSCERSATSSRWMSSLSPSAPMVKLSFADVATAPLAKYALGTEQPVNSSGFSRDIPLAFKRLPLAWTARSWHRLGRTERFDFGIGKPSKNKPCFLDCKSKAKP